MYKPARLLRPFLSPSFTLVLFDKVADDTTDCFLITSDDLGPKTFDDLDSNMTMSRLVTFAIFAMYMYGAVAGPLKSCCDTAGMTGRQWRSYTNSVRLCLHA